MADSANSKAPKMEPKLMDVARPKRASTLARPLRKLMISPRPIMNRSIAVSTPTDGNSGTDLEPQAAPTQLPSSKKPTIAPLGTPDTPPTPPQPEESANTDQEEDKDSPADQAVLPKTSDVPATTDGAPADKTAEPDTADTPEPQSKETSEEPEQPNGASEPADSTATPETDEPQGPTKQPTVDTRKAVEEAKRATKRKEELEKYIDSKEFFIPINAAARQRSIKVSGLLTVVIFLLGLALIDLMIDSGIILLVQKIPHTHFFTGG